MPGESLHADLSGLVVPMGIRPAKYILVAVDELKSFSRVFPMRKKAQTPRCWRSQSTELTQKSSDQGHPGCAACTQIKMVNSSQTHWRSSATGRGSSTHSLTGHSINRMASLKGTSASSMRRRVQPYSPMTCWPTCGRRCAWPYATSRTWCPVARCSGS